MRTELDNESASSWPTAVDLAALARRVAVPMALGVALGTLAGVVVGSLLTGGPGEALDRFDLEVVERLVSARTDALDRLSAAAVLVADTLPVAILWFAAAMVALWRTRSWTLPVFICVVVGGEKLTYLLTSLVVGRPRPPVDSLGHVFATTSFPSGHVGSAVSLYGAVVVALLWQRSRDGRPLPRAVVVAAVGAVVAVTMLVAFGRVYRGQHYPSDVVWGAALGVAWLAFGWKLLLGSATRTRSQVEPSSGRH